MYIIHCYQEESGWCGIACWQMILKTIGLNISQSELRKFISNKNWGTSHEDHIKIAKNYFLKYQSKENWSLEGLQSELNMGFLVICNIWDDYETYDHEPADGHYVVLKEINNDKKIVTILDPSGSQRVSGRSGVYDMSFDEFNNHWHDYLDQEKKQKTEHWAICVNSQLLKIVILPNA
jgi:ABC-type bacteriocin/lantibiotic exporter with double-glycine peptidase domain